MTILRTICTQTPKEILWRDTHPYLLAEDVSFVANDDNEVLADGVVRIVCEMNNIIMILIIEHWYIAGKWVRTRSALFRKPSCTLAKLWRLSTERGIEIYALNDT